MAVRAARAGAMRVSACLAVIIQIVAPGAPGQRSLIAYDR
jgi:hypothetical protein